jgi:hypothetical protein
MFKAFLTALTLTAALAVAVAPLASAKDGDVLVRGTCTKASTSKLKLSEENGRVEIEFEVDQNRNGVRWNVVLRRNGLVVRRAVRITRVRAPRAVRPRPHHRHRDARRRDVPRGGLVLERRLSRTAGPLSGRPRSCAHGASST